MGVVGFEPTQSEGNRFTVCRVSPTTPHSQKGRNNITSGLMITTKTVISHQAHYSAI